MITNMPESVKTFVAARIDKQDKEFLKELAEKIGAGGISEALRYCITFARLVAEGNVVISFLPEYVFSEPFLRLAKRRK